MKELSEIKNKFLFLLSGNPYYGKIRIWSLRSLGFEVAKDAYIGANLTVISPLQIRNKIYIEPRVSIAPNVTIILSSHPNNSLLRNVLKTIRGDVIIGEDSWIGTGVIIYPGVTIGKCAVLAAGSVVTKDVESYTIVSGIPAKFLRKIDSVDLIPDEPVVDKEIDNSSLDPQDYQWDIKNPNGYNNKSGIYKTKIELDFILKYINKGQKAILDMGGGSGRFALPLLNLGHDVTVVDLNAEAIKICSERGINKAFCRDIRDVLPDKFDVVIAIELFLVTTPSEVFDAAYKQLKQDGIFIFVGTNKKSWRYKLHNLRKVKAKNYGEFTGKEYKKLLKSSNFEIIKMKGFNWMPFRVNSDNRLIPFFAFIEKALKLNYWINQSPWLLVACRKTEK